jgi:hypothetical protein
MRRNHQKRRMKFALGTATSAATATVASSTTIIPFAATQVAAAATTVEEDKVDQGPSSLRNVFDHSGFGVFGSTIRPVDPRLT